MLQASYRSIKYRYMQFGWLLCMCVIQFFHSLNTLQLHSASPMTPCTYMPAVAGIYEEQNIKIRMKMHHSMIDTNAELYFVESLKSSSYRVCGEWNTQFFFACKYVEHIITFIFHPKSSESSRDYHYIVKLKSLPASFIISFTSSSLYIYREREQYRHRVKRLIANCKLTFFWTLPALSKI